MLGIIGAMEVEVEKLRAKMTETEMKTVAGMNFCKGKLEGKDVVIVRSGIGKVNAGICSQILVDLYQVDGIVNTGIAGSLRNEINIGDLVLSTVAVQHDVDAGGFGYPVGEIPQLGEFLAEYCFHEVELMPYHTFGRSKYEALGRAYASIPGKPDVEGTIAALKKFGLNVSVQGTA